MLINLNKLTLPIPCIFYCNYLLHCFYVLFILLFVSFIQNSFTIILSVHLILKLLLMEENGQNQVRNRL